MPNLKLRHLTLAAVVALTCVGISQQPQAQDERAYGRAQQPHGPLVKRGAGSLQIEIADAKGQAIDLSATEHYLYRMLGSYSLLDHGEAAEGASHVLYNGVLGEGLEPGEYQFELHARFYGTIVKRFTLTRGEHKKLSLRTPYWRRIVSFRFVDQDGTAVPYIDNYPTYSGLPEGSMPTLGERSPRDVVRPVLREEGGPTGGGGRGGAGGFKRTRDRTKRCYATEDGRFYAQVFAGFPGLVGFKFNKDVWGTDSYLLEGKFDEPEWQEPTVVLPLPGNFSERLKEWSKEGSDNPGNRSLLSIGDPKPVDDPATVPAGKCRVLLTLDAPARIVPVVATPKDGAHAKALLAWPQTPMQRRDSTWYFDADRGTALSLGFTDRCLFVQQAEVIDVPDAPMHALSRSIESPTAVMPQWKLPPTSEAWAVERFLLVADQWSGINGRTMFLFPKWISIPLGQTVLTGGPLGGWMTESGQVMYTWELRGPFTGDRYGKTAGGFNNAPGAKFWQEVVSGKVLPPPLSDGLALRAVGDSDEGLPWVHGVLFTVEEDKAAREVLEAERQLAKEETQWRPKTVPEGHFAKLRTAQSKGDHDTIREMVPETIRPLLKSNEACFQAAAYGAWYLGHRPYELVKTDPHGYYVTLDRELKPGTEYVIYLWSRSRDDLHPDVRITFTATDGCVDLGVVRMPSYK